MFLIGIPSKPGRSFHRCCRNIVGKIAINVIAKCNILITDHSAIIIIKSQRIVFCIIVEVEAGILCIIMSSLIIPRSCSMCIVAKKRSPTICKFTISTVLRLTCCCRISSLGISRDVIPVIYITQKTISHIYRLDTAICFSIICSRRISVRIVLKPILKMLIVFFRICVSK